MIDAGTVAAYLTLDTADFVKGIASAGQMLTQFRNEQSDGLNGVDAMLSGLGSLILEKLGGIVSSLQSSSALGALPDILASKAASAAQGFMAGISGLPNAIIGLGSSVLGNFNGVVGSLAGSAVLGNLPSIMRSKGTLTMQGLISGIVNQGGAASSSMRSIMTAVRSSASSVSFTSVGKNIIGGVMSGMNSRRASLMAVASTIASGISGVMRSALKINSPSRVMMEIGEFTAAGMELGLANGADRLYDTASHISHETVEALSGMTYTGSGGLNTLSASGGGSAYDLLRISGGGDRLSRLIDAVERLAASQSTVEIDGRSFGRLVREYV